MWWNSDVIRFEYLPPFVIHRLGGFQKPKPHALRHGDCWVVARHWTVKSSRFQFLIWWVSRSILTPAYMFHYSGLDCLYEAPPHSEKNHFSYFLLAKVVNLNETTKDLEIFFLQILHFLTFGYIIHPIARRKTSLYQQESYPKSIEFVHRLLVLTWRQIRGRLTT